MNVEAKLPYAFCERCSNRELEEERIYAFGSLTMNYLVCRNSKLCQTAVGLYKEQLRNEEKGGADDKANKWISVEEALPEVGDVVLAMGKRHATTGQFQGIGSKPCYWWWKGKTIKTVTHWRPLPPPPIEGSADDV